MKNNKGGKVLASGGYGCVFTPALKCEGSKKREKDKYQYESGTHIGTRMINKYTEK
jgi:hypothetical protein